MGSADLDALRKAAYEAGGSMLTPPAIRQALPALVRVLDGQARALQELRELVRQPCEGCGGCGGRRQAQGIGIDAPDVGRDEAGMPMLAVAIGTGRGG